MTTAFHEGLREYRGELSDAFTHCIDGATYVQGVLVYPHIEQLTKYTIDGETPKCIECYNSSDIKGCLTCRMTKQPCVDVDICNLYGKRPDPTNSRKE